MANTKRPDVLPVAKCMRIVRPLVAKIHALTDLYIKNPAAFRFDVDLVESVDVAKFSNPQTSHDRLTMLKPYLAPEVYQAYAELLAIFRNIVASMYHEPKRTKDVVENKTRPVQRLSSLAALKLGKSVALGTKSTYYSLNQAMLFDPDSIPRHLQKYQLELADGIGEWLQMEPMEVTKENRSDLLLGYVFHVLVLNLRTTLFALLPVLVHWLHEQGLVSCRTLFLEYWLYLPRDPDSTDVLELSVGNSSDPTIELFWLYHRIGYWRQLAEDIHIVPADGYETLLLHALGSTDRLVLDVVELDRVLHIMALTIQHPQNTSILVSVVAQIITHFKKQFNAATTSSKAHAALNRLYIEIRSVVESWLPLNSQCIYNSLDSGNEEIFAACSQVLRYSQGKCAQIIKYLSHLEPVRRIEEVLRKFKYLYQQFDLMQVVLGILQVYYLDLDEPLSLHGLKPSLVAEYFVELMEKFSDTTELLQFFYWLEDYDNDEITEFLYSCRGLLEL